MQAQTIDFTVKNNQQFKIDSPDFVEQGYDIEDHTGALPFNLGVIEDAFDLNIGTLGFTLWADKNKEEDSHDLRFYYKPWIDINYPILERDLDIDTVNKEVRVLYKNLQLKGYTGQSVSLYYELAEKGVVSVGVAENNLLNSHPWNQEIMELTYFSEYNGHDTDLVIAVFDDPSDPKFEVFKGDEWWDNPERYYLTRFPEAGTMYTMVPDITLGIEDLHKASNRYSVFVIRTPDFIDIKLENISNVNSIKVYDNSGRLLDSYEDFSHSKIRLPKSISPVAGSAILYIEFTNGEVVSKKL